MLTRKNMGRLIKCKIGAASKFLKISPNPPPTYQSPLAIGYIGRYIAHITLCLKIELKEQFFSLLPHRRRVPIKYEGEVVTRLFIYKP